MASLASMASLVLPYKGPIAAQGPYGLGHIRFTKNLGHIMFFFLMPLDEAAKAKKKQKTLCA